MLTMHVMLMTISFDRLKERNAEQVRSELFLIAKNTQLYQLIIIICVCVCVCVCVLF